MSTQPHVPRPVQSKASRSRALDAISDTKTKIAEKEAEARRELDAANANALIKFVDDVCSTIAIFEETRTGPIVSIDEAELTACPARDSKACRRKRSLKALRNLGKVAMWEKLGGEVGGSESLIEHVRGVLAARKRYLRNKVGLPADVETPESHGAIMAGPAGASDAVPGASACDAEPVKEPVKRPRKRLRKLTATPRPAVWAALPDDIAEQFPIAAEPFVSKTHTASRLLGVLWDPLPPPALPPLTIATGLLLASPVVPPLSAQPPEWAHTPSRDDTVDPAIAAPEDEHSILM